jgi:RimJ/RimL family protein N-acetyltransferase
VKNPLRVRIERMAPRHVRGYWKVLDSVARERRYLLLLEAPPIKSARVFVSERLAKGDSFFVAVAGSEVVGWCNITSADHEGIRHIGRLGMGIRRDFRGRGIGTLLLKRALSDAFARGLSRIELEVFASNTPAVALYEKMGFVHEGRKRKGRRLGGVWEDNLVMGLLKEEAADLLRAGRQGGCRRRSKNAKKK